MGEPEPGGQRRAEELVVGGPHERVVDDGGPFEHGVLEVAAVVRDLVRDPVDEHGVGHRLVHPGAAEPGELGDDAGVPPVHLVDELRRERPLAAHDQADLLHGDLVVLAPLRVAATRRS